MTDTPITDAIDNDMMVAPRDRLQAFAVDQRISRDNEEAIWNVLSSGSLFPDEKLYETRKERKGSVDLLIAQVWEHIQQQRAIDHKPMTVTPAMQEHLDFEELAFGPKGNTTRLKNRANYRALLMREGMSARDADEKLAAVAEEWGASLSTMTPGTPPKRVELLRAAQLRDFTGGGTEKPDTKVKDALGHGSDQGGDDGATNPWHPDGIDKHLGRYSDAAIKRQADFVRLAGVAKANAVAAKFNRKVGDMK